MTAISHWRLSLVAGLAGLLLLSACSNPDSAWQAAEQEGTEEALLAFLGDYPDSPQAAEARQRVVAINVRRDWEAALDDGSAVALEAFLQKHPDSEQAWEARERLEAFRLQDADTALTEVAPAAESPAVAPAPAAAEPPPAPEPPASQPTTQAPPLPAAPAGTYRVQLAALGSVAAAEREQQRISASMGDVLGGTQLQVSSEAGTHRVVTAPLVEQQARALCSQLQATGQDCFVRSR